MVTVIGVVAALASVNGAPTPEQFGPGTGVARGHLIEATVRAEV